MRGNYSLLKSERVGNLREMECHCSTQLSRFAIFLAYFRQESHIHSGNFVKSEYNAKCVDRITL